MGGRLAAWLLGKFEGRGSSTRAPARRRCSQAEESGLPFGSKMMLGWGSHRDWNVRYESLEKRSLIDILYRGKDLMSDA